MPEIRRVRTGHPTGMAGPDRGDLHVFPGYRLIVGRAVAVFDGPHNDRTPPAGSIVALKRVLWEA